ncbi:hypothetical protein VTL71DRAFT_6640 [Oculimacula yallundae]|uniref:Uncharacterized protein n=1 Tax=Oculimacula yallundae TaxID=86028 RepID=A0ABR4BZ79_9HELO
MHMLSIPKCAIAILVAIVIIATGYPLDDQISRNGLFSVIPRGLVSRAPVALPAPPVKLPAAPKRPDNLRGNLNPGGPSLQTNPLYIEPPSYGKFTEKGRTLQQAFEKRRVTDPDNNNDYGSKIGSYQDYDAPTAVAPRLEGVANDLERITGVSFKQGNWKKYNIKAGGPPGEDGPAVIYHSPEQKSIVVSELYNKQYGADFPLDKKIPFSELIFQSWSREAGQNVADLKYITMADIVPLEYRTVVQDARKLKDANKHAEGGVISFDSTSLVQADRDAFAALSGMENTRNAFYMLTDHKGALQGKGSTIIHTTGEGERGGSALHITFELTD